MERKGFVGSIDGKTYLEVGPSGLAPAVERSFVVLPGDAHARWKGYLRRPLKWAVRGLYSGPAFFVAACAASLISPVARDTVVVGFVCLLVVFFTLLSPYLVLSAWAFRLRESGRARLRPPFTPAGRAAEHVRHPAPSPASGRTLGERVSLLGTVVELEPRSTPSGPVVVDGWFEHADPPGRLTEASDFAVVTEGDRVGVIECLAAPTLIATPRTQPTTSMLETLGAATRDAFARHGPVTGAEAGEWVTLHAGDRVEVTGHVVRGLPNLRSFELSGRARSVPGGSQSGPYRGASRRDGVLLRCDHQAPVTIRRVGDHP